MSTAFGLTTQIYNNHIKSILLLMGFPLLLLLMIGAFFMCLNLAAQATPAHYTIDWMKAIRGGWGGILGFGHWAFLGAGAWFMVAYFFHGSIVRAATGAHPVTRQENPKLYNLLENLCISRGLPMPSFEIIETPALNAFASGIDQKSYRIVVTRGLLETLSDDELEAVLGHELTHIINKDVRLLIISVIFVGIISFLLQMVYRMLASGFRPRYRRDNRERNGGGALVMLIALAVLVVGYVLAIVIRFALSRKREYLADAGSIELTKNPEAMMRALQKIAGHDRVPGMPGEVQQMCIENSHNFMGLFATHPSVEDRIRTISEMTNTPIPQMQVNPETLTARGPWGK